MASPDAPITYRAAALADVEGLVALENTCFHYDRMSRRSFRHHIRSENRNSSAWRYFKRLQAFAKHVFV